MTSPDTRLEYIQTLQRLNMDLLRAEQELAAAANHPLLKDALNRYITATNLLIGRTQELLSRLG